MTKKTVRPRITDDEYKVVLDLRERHSALAAECISTGVPVEDVNIYWYKGKNFSIQSKVNKGISYDAVRDDLIKDLIKHSPKYPVIKRKKVTDSLLSVVDVADPHFGKYSSNAETGESYSIKEAESRFLTGMDSLCAKLEREKIDNIVYVGGNDRLHTDNPFGTTTSGTKQDTDGMWHEAFLSAKRCDIAAIERLLTIANVHFVHCPSNHDFMSGFFLSDTIKSHFHNCKNITFDTTPIHRKYIQYGNSLIGLTHGDGAKEGDLSDLMKTECKRGWAMSKFAYWYVHHKHHKIRNAFKGTEKIKLEKDMRGLTVLHTGAAVEPSDYAHVEYVRSMSGTDRWHFTNSFVHAPKAIEMFLHHKEYGQIERYSHLF